MGCFHSQHTQDERSKTGMVDSRSKAQDDKGNFHFGDVAKEAHIERSPEIGSLYGGRKAPLQLHVLVVGCGLGGLAAAYTLVQAGHRVTMFESASAIGEVGAGIQVSPNVTRLLHRWGLKDKLAEIAVRPEGIVFRRYDNGERVGYTRWGDKIEKEYGCPYYHIHRADFHRLLYELVQDKVEIKLKSTVVGVDAEAPSVTLQTGEVVNGDLIIGADGVKSYVQEVVVGVANPADPTGDAAYRALIPTDFMLADPELRPFVDEPEMTAWMGPRRHLMAYNVRSKKEFNLVLIHPDDGSVESWTAGGSADKMRADFADYDPRVRKMLDKVSSTLKWRLMDRQPLSTWVHAAGRVALLGDSCHPMLPYRAQGAAMAIEDAGVLGNLLSRVAHVAQLGPLLRAYEALRLARTADTQASSRLNQKIFHLVDGPEQRERDEQMRAAMRVEMGKAEGAEEAGALDAEGNPNQWADRKKSEIQFGYDADAEAEKWWAANAKEIETLAKASI